MKLLPLFRPGRQAHQHAHLTEIRARFGRIAVTADTDLPPRKQVYDQVKFTGIMVGQVHGGDAVKL
jgi:hypothetical protein